MWSSGNYKEIEEKAANILSQWEMWSSGNMLFDPPIFKFILSQWEMWSSGNFVSQSSKASFNSITVGNVV